MPTHLETVARLKQESVRDALGHASKADLEAYAAALCNPNAFGEFGDRQFPQICETVRIHLLRAHVESLQDHVVELHNHITKLNTSNSNVQKWVIALAVASLIGTAVQVIAAIRSELRAEPPTLLSSPPQQQSTLPAATPSQALPLSSGQSRKKTP